MIVVVRQPKGPDQPSDVDRFARRSQRPDSGARCSCQPDNAPRAATVIAVSGFSVFAAAPWGSMRNHWPQRLQRTRRLAETRSQERVPASPQLGQVTCNFQ